MVVGVGGGGGGAGGLERQLSLQRSDKVTITLSSLFIYKSYVCATVFVSAEVFFPQYNYPTAWFQVVCWLYWRPIVLKCLHLLFTFMFGRRLLRARPHLNVFKMYSFSLHRKCIS